MTTYNIGPGQAYETFAALEAAVVLAGDDIVDGGGNTFTSTWTPATSGTAGHQIVLQNATIDLRTTVSSWTNDGDGTYSKTGIASCAFFIENNTILVNAASSAVTPGQWYHTGTTLHYAPTDGTLDTESTKIVAENSYGINISDRSYITVQNINFAYIHYGVFAYQSAAVSSGIVLTNNTYTRCRAGVLLSTANANTFTGNFITHSVFTECSAGIKCDTRVSSGDISTGVHTGYEITDNEFYNTGYASGSSGQWDTLIAGSADQECIGMQNTQSSIIARNKMVNGYTKGIYLYIRETGSVLNNTVTRNLFKNLAGDTALTIAGSLSGAELSNNVITYNIFDTCTGSFVLWFMNVVSPAATYNIIQNNTFYKGATAIYCPYSASNANAGEYYKILNNIFDQQSSYFVFLGSDPTNFDCDYSLYSTVTGNKWAWDNNAKSWAQWAAYGHDDHTLTAVSPYFVNQYEDDFRLQSVSPAIDVGVAHSYVYDFHGNVVTGLTEDIGACERVTEHPLRFD